MTLPLTKSWIKYMSFNLFITLYGPLCSGRNLCSFPLGCVYSTYEFIGYTGIREVQVYHMRCTSIREVPHCRSMTECDVLVDVSECRVNR